MEMYGFGSVGDNCYESYELKCLVLAGKTVMNDAFYQDF